MKSEHEIIVAWLVVIAVVAVAMFVIAFEPLRKGAAAAVPVPAQVVAPPAYVAPALPSLTERELMLMCLHSRTRGQGYKCVRG